tara:strand:- start:104 stop:574 length:471 start_codon:yes stop_codon:yes gene_type:complete
MSENNPFRFSNKRLVKECYDNILYIYRDCPLLLKYQIIIHRINQYKKEYNDICIELSTIKKNANGDISKVSYDDKILIIKLKHNRDVNIKIMKKLEYLLSKLAQLIDISADKEFDANIPTHCPNEKEKKNLIKKVKISTEPFIEKLNKIINNIKNK